MNNCLMYADRLSPINKFLCAHLSPSISGDFNMSPNRLIRKRATLIRKPLTRTKTKKEGISISPKLPKIIPKNLCADSLTHPERKQGREMANRCIFLCRVYFLTGKCTFLCQKFANIKYFLYLCKLLCAYTHAMCVHVPE